MPRIPRVIVPDAKQARPAGRRACPGTGYVTVASALTRIDPPLLIGIDPLTCFLPIVSRGNASVVVID
jgi:hypothetical protein